MRELERLTIGTKDALYDEFLKELTENSVTFLYGAKRMLLAFTSCLTYRSFRSPIEGSPYLGRSAATALNAASRSSPASRISFRSRTRKLAAPISHNQAQTVVLGINQLTTGLSAHWSVLRKSSQAERERMIAERLLPACPSMNTHHAAASIKTGKRISKRVETAFPSGNSAFMALREDSDAMQRYLPCSNRN